MLFAVFVEKQARILEIHHSKSGHEEIMKPVVCLFLIPVVIELEETF